MGDRRIEDARRATNPVFNDRKLKLGTFGTNVSNACSMTTIEGRYEPTWPNTLAIARLADAMEFEAMVPVARWKGFGGATDFNGRNFEVYTWAAGLGASTRHASIMATSHVPTVHPIMAAKQATTIDHITGGRFSLNIVCGWYRDELDMFGARALEHDEAYDYAAEWLDVMLRLWTEGGAFDHAGKYFTIDRAAHAPKPIQAPWPALMNAGKSVKGQHFAAKYCDLAFVVYQSYDLDDIARMVEDYRSLARNEYGREIQVWSYAYVVQRETEAEARDYLNHYVLEKGDREACTNLLTSVGVPMDKMPGDTLEEAMFHFMAGWRGYTAQPADYQSYADFGRDGRERCESYRAPPRPMPTVQP